MEGDSIVHNLDINGRRNETTGTDAAKNYMPGVRGITISEIIRKGLNL
jgi:hypothetical protein